MRRACLFLMLTMALASAQVDWGERIARIVSQRPAEIAATLERIEAELETLPKIPVDDQGGSGGFAREHARPEADAEDPHTMEVEWGERHLLDCVVLVPARRYDARGLEPQFGMPDSFVIELLGPDGTVTRTCRSEEHLWRDPVRAGHPFLFQLEPAVEAVGLRVRAGTLPPNPDNGDSYVHAWAECLVFQGERNVAWGARAEGGSGINTNAPWQWAPEFLVDGQTPLGLPESAEGEEHNNVGWLSVGKPSAGSGVVLEMDLGTESDFDEMTLFPAKRPTSDLPAGFGFPVELTLYGSSRHDQMRESVLGHWVMSNPGHNPVTRLTEARGVRYLRFHVNRLWKAYDSYPAFCALSEIELLGAQGNVALGARVTSPDGLGNVVAAGGKYWGALSLTDGYGPEGRLVPTLEWLKQLDRRLILERQRHVLRGELAALARKWQRAGMIAGGGTTLLALLLLVALPVRFRARERKKLLEVRERIAGDLHDEVGSNLGSIQMYADLAEGRTGRSDELDRIQRIAAETVSAVRDIVWLLRPGGEHRIATMEHLRETTSIMLEQLDWEFTANEAAWACELSEEQNRHLFLFFREALHNIVRHSHAKSAQISVRLADRQLDVMIHDDGQGIPPDKLARKSTLRALRQRGEALRAEFGVKSAVGEGTTLELKVPLGRRSR